MRIALLGAPGSGKGTQAKMLAEKYRVPHISTGDLLREAVAKDRQFGKGVRAAMDAGVLVTDEVVLELLEERLRKKDTKRGFIVDGFPRNIPQAQALDTLLGMLGRNLQVVVNIQVDEDILVKRITGRVNCDECGAIYNKYFSPPKVRGKCNQCGCRKLSARSDDSEKVVGIRVQIYNENTAPLITYYKAQHKMRTVNSMLGIEEVHNKICGIVDLEIRPLEVKFVETAADSLDEDDVTVIAGGQINKIPASEVEARKQAAEARATQIAEMKQSKAAKERAAEKTDGEKIAKTTKKKNTQAKKSAVKKVPAKKVTKKTVAKKTTAKKTTKKAVSKKTAVKKPVAKKAIKKKTVSKKKTAVKKPTGEKVTKKKVVSKKTVSKKTVVKKTTKKVTKKKAPTKKVIKKVTKKKVAKKKTGKKKSGK